MTIKQKVLRLLGDGRFHSGQSLGTSLGVSRAAVWKAIQGLQKQYAISIQSVPGRGYRLASPLELLDVEQITKQISAKGKTLLGKLEVLPIVDSTNEHMLKVAGSGQPSGSVLLAEQQNAGRGRRGRPWVSPFGANLYLSLLWRFDLSVQDLSGLGIAVAVAVSKALSRFAPDLGIKWPNDILWQNRKLAGILLEIQGETQGPVVVVVGVGVNIQMSTDVGKMIDQPWVDLATMLDQPVSRQAIAGAVIDELLQAMLVYQQQGLVEFLAEWRQRDILLDQPLEIILGDRNITGIGRGIDSSGAIQIEHNGKLTRYMAGDVSLRQQQNKKPGQP